MSLRKTGCAIVNRLIQLMSSEEGAVLMEDFEEGRLDNDRLRDLAKLYNIEV